MACLIEGEWSCYGGGQCNRGSMIVRGGQFNGGRMVVMEVVSLMEGAWSCYRSGHCNEGRMVMLHINVTVASLVTYGRMVTCSGQITEW